MPLARNWTCEQVISARALYRAGVSNAGIARMLHGDPSNVLKMLKGYTYKDIPGALHDREIRSYGKDAQRSPQDSQKRPSRVRMAPCPTPEVNAKIEPVFLASPRQVAAA